jgi:nucleoside transporter
LEASATQFVFAAGASVLMAVYSLFALPHTPPPAKGQQITWQRAVGLDTLSMMKEPSFAVFVIASILACIPLTFYFSFTNAYLNEVGVVNAAGKMTLGQVSEVGVMLLMPFIFRRITVRGVLMLGLICWSLRYGLLAYGNAGPAVWMFYLAILLHGFCFDFFFMTGQLYTDQEAPAHLRGTAQGFLTFVTYGVGMFIGSELSGGALDYFTKDGHRDWTSFWLSSGAGAFIILLVIVAFFRTNAKIETKKAGEGVRSRIAAGYAILIVGTVLTMGSAKAYEEIIDFIARGTTPESVVAFRPSDALQGRVRDLTERAREGSVSPEERSELEDCLQLEHIVIMAKARARQHIQVGQ